MPALIAVSIMLSACGGSSNSGSGSRFDEIEIGFRNLGTTVECDGTVVERGVNPNGSTWIRCTWPCGINGPRSAERHFYVRTWQRPDRSSPFQFIGDRIEDSICR